LIWIKNRLSAPLDVFELSMVQMAEKAALDTRWAIRALKIQHRAPPEAAAPPTSRGSSRLEDEARGSIAGYIPSLAMRRDSTIEESRWLKISATAGSVKSSAGT
jgi:hypothetical protein